MTRRVARIIPRLDVKGPNLIKGICFEGLRAIGLPEEFARRYSDEGADEIILYDTVASLFQRGPGLETIEKVADEISIPLVVAGGIRTLDDVSAVLRAGADKVAINTAAVRDASLLRNAADRFGAQCVVASIEVFRRERGRFEVWTEYGREATGLDALEWIRTAIGLGVGEILLSFIDRDGTGEGTHADFVRRVAELVPCPVIVGGGIGRAEHAAAALEAGADAVHLAAALHYRYVRPVGRAFMSSNSTELRCGAPIDLGNADWVNNGYGGSRSVLVQPTTIGELKRHLQHCGFAFREMHVRQAAIARMA